MKIRMYKIVLMMCLVAFFSCEEKETEIPTLTVSTEEIVLGISGVTELDAPAVFDVNSSAGWILTCTDSWLIPSVSSGNSGNTPVSIGASPTTAERVGYITVRNEKRGDVYAIITVTQVMEDLVPSTLEVSAEEIAVEYTGNTTEGNQATIKISTNKKWTITDLPAWVTAIPASGVAGTDINVLLLIAKNEQMERTANFTIQAGTKSENVTVTQYAEFQYLIVLPTTVAVESDGKNADGVLPKITLSTNKDWSIIGLPTWISASPASGFAGSDMSVTLTVAVNDLGSRSGKFTVNAGYLSEEITVNQSDDVGYQRDNMMFVNIGKDLGTTVGQLDVNIIEHADYWEIVSTGDFPSVPLSLNRNLPVGTLTWSFEYEYQLSADIPGLWYVPLWNNTAIDVYGVGLTATAGVDPNNEAYWTKITPALPMWSIVGVLNWGFNDDLDMCLWFRDDVPRTMLIRNIKVIAE